MSTRTRPLFLVAALALFCATMAHAVGLPKIPSAPKAPALPKTEAGAPGGADPKGWLNRADAFLAQVEGATACLESGRAALFSLSATSEEKALLKARQEEAKAAGQDVVLATRQLQEDVLKKAEAEKRHEARKLSDKQKENLTRLGGNLLLAVANDTQALANGKALVDQADDALKAVKNPQVAMGLGADAKRIVGVPEKMKSAMAGIPTQLTALDALLKSVGQARGAGAAPLKAAASYETLEEF
jgi:hypothetical protein